MPKSECLFVFFVCLYAFRPFFEGFSSMGFEGEVNMINTVSKIDLSKIGWEGGGSTSIWIMSFFLGYPFAKEFGCTADPRLQKTGISDMTWKKATKKIFDTPPMK